MMLFLLQEEYHCSFNILLVIAAWLYAVAAILSLYCEGIGKIIIGPLTQLCSCPIFT